jgi:hypothetical protein
MRVPVASATGTSFVDALRQLRVRGTVCEKGIRHEDALVDGHAADLACPIGAVTKPFQRAVDVVQRCFNCTDTLVGEIGHVSKLSVAHDRGDLLLSQYQGR